MTTRKRSRTIYLEESEGTLFANLADQTPVPGNTIRIRRGGSFTAGQVLDVVKDATLPAQPLVRVLTLTGKVKKYRYVVAGRGFRLVPTR